MWFFSLTQATDTFLPTFLESKMNKEKLISHCRYLTLLMASAIKKTPPPIPFEGIDWCFLIKLAEHHNTLLMIAPCLKKLNLPEKAQQLFKSLYNFYIARLTRQSIEAGVAMSALDNEKIRYLKMKGSHIKEYYPEEFMRSFNDIDLLVDSENREKAGNILKSLGYELKSTTDYHDEYEKDSFFIYEIHTRMVSQKEKYKGVFENPFEKSLAESQGSGYKLKSEYLYLHLFFHLYKHFTVTGCGIRFFADFLVFENYIKDADTELIFSVLKKYKMTGFYNTLKKLMAYFFEGKDADKNTEKIAEYIFTSSTTGDSMQDMANYSVAQKLRYFLKIWFPPAIELCKKYPVLKKAPVLLPVCWVRRGFSSLFLNRTSLKSHINEVRRVNSNEYKNIKKTRQIATKQK